jgi:membrane associated rhomboid family serine protease
MSSSDVFSEPQSPPTVAVHLPLGHNQPVHARFSKQLGQIIILLAILYVVHAISAFTTWDLRQYGIVPRSVTGLRGIFFCPLLHGDWQHLIANTVPLGVMLTLMAINKKEGLWGMTGLLWAASGLGVWIVGRPDSLQIGASSLIYALASYFITTAWRTRHLGAMLTAVVVSFLYGGIVWGMLPTRPGVSWEGHIAGAVAGVLVALTIHPRRDASTPLANPPANPTVKW